MELNARTEALRERIERGSMLVVPGAFNALTARMVEEAGFEAVYATGAGIANAYLGVPDVGLLTQTEMLAHVRAMVEATSLPVLVDIDTGYGGVHNVVRTVSEAEATGASALQIEDQTFPKRCGHFDNKALVPVHEMVAKILAAIETRRRGILLIARTDAIAVEGFEAAVSRARIYREAGADVLFVEAPTDQEQIRSLPELIEAPLLINMVEGGVTPFLAPDVLEELGYSIVAFANFGLRVMMKALRSGLSDLRDARSSAGLIEDIVTWEERQATVGLDGYDERERIWHKQAVDLENSIEARPTGRERFEPEDG